MNNLQDKNINNIIDIQIGYEKYRFQNTKYNCGMNEINDYIELCNNNHDDEITLNLLDEVFNGCVEDLHRTRPF